MGVIEFLNRVFPPKESDQSRNVGRNESCWCGSGKKYKACHLPADEKKRLGRKG